MTFRLADSLPQEVIARLAERRDLLTAKAAEIADRRLVRQREIERLLDRGAGACHLRHPAVAGIVADALRHFAGIRYVLHAWVVMPNHVHALLTPLGGHALGGIVKSWKQFASTRAKGVLRLPPGRFWQPEA